MIYIGADYAGFKLKGGIKEYLQKKGISFLDIGTHTDKVRNDFTEFIPPVVKNVKRSAFHKGILICGSGYGMAIGANRFKGIRATLAFDQKQARYSKTHDNSNILVLSAWTTPKSQAVKVLRTWLKTQFQPLPRRVRRFKKVDQWPK